MKIMKQRILYALAQILVVTVCAVLIPEGALLVDKLTGEPEPAIFGWGGVFVLILIYAAMSAAVSALILGTNAFLAKHRSRSQTILAIIVGILHGFVFLLSFESSLQRALAAPIAVSVIVVVVFVIHLVRMKQNKCLHVTSHTRRT